VTSHTCARDATIECPKHVRDYHQAAAPMWRRHSILADAALLEAAEQDGDIVMATERTENALFLQGRPTLDQNSRCCSPEPHTSRDLSPPAWVRGDLQRKSDCLAFR
jgi:hypothetical protein